MLPNYAVKGKAMADEFIEKYAVANQDADPNESAYYLLAMARSLEEAALEALETVSRW